MTERWKSIVIVEGPNELMVRLRLPTGGEWELECLGDDCGALHGVIVPLDQQVIDRLVLELLRIRPQVKPLRGNDE